LPSFYQYYFAVLAVDGAGNFSVPVGDDLLVSVVSDVSEEDLASVLGTETDEASVTTGDREATLGTSDEGDSLTVGIGLALLLAILGYIAWLFLAKQRASSVFDDGDNDQSDSDRSLF